MVGDNVALSFFKRRYLRRAAFQEVTDIIVDNLDSADDPNQPFCSPSIEYCLYYCFTTILIYTL